MLELLVVRNGHGCKAILRILYMSKVYAYRAKIRIAYATYLAYMLIVPLLLTLDPDYI